MAHGGPQALSAVPLPGRLDDARRGSPPLVGRERELLALTAALDPGDRPGPGLAIAYGEPGIGKTRLVAEIGALAHAAGATVLYGRSDDDAQIPYQPFVEALDHLALHASAAVRDRLDEHADELAPLLPQLRSGGRAREAALDDPGSERYALFRAVASLLSAATAQRRMVLIVDDLHWADQPTLRLVAHLLATPIRPNVLVVGTYRTTEVEIQDAEAGALADLQRHESAVRLELAGLDEQAVCALTGELAGRELEPPERAFARALARDTAGNPFFVREVLWSLVESGAIDRVDGRWTANAPLEEVGVPTTVRQVLRRRIAHLGPEARPVLDGAATIGPTFAAALLEEVLDNVAQASVAGVLDRAERAGLVTAHPGGRAHHAFVHALVARTLYDDQGAAQRARLHRRIAEALERTETIPAAQHTFALARHWGAASPTDPQRAGHYAEQAGRLAIDQSEPQAAQRWLARALELHDDTAQSPQRRLDLLIALGVAQRQDGQPAFRETLLEAARLARAAGDTERLAEAALANNRGFVSSSGVLDDERVAVLEAALEAVGAQDEHRRARLLALLAAELAFTGRRRERTRLSDEALALARRLGDPAALSFVLNIRFVPIWAPDTLAERLANTAESMRLADRLGDAFAQFQAVHWRALGLVQAGRLDEATAAVARETKLAATLGDPTFVWMAAYDRANLAMIAGRLEEAEALAGEALAVATASGQPDGFTFWGSQVFGIRHEQGRLSEFLAVAAQMVGEHPGLPSLRAGLALAYVQTNLPDDARELLVAEAATGFEELPEDVIWLSSHVMYAHVCADVGEREIARTLSERLAAWPDVVAYTGLNAWGTAGHAIGRLAVLLERHDEAEEHLTTALAAYRRMGAPVWHARAALDSARLFMTRGAPGDRDRARTLLEHAAAEAARLGSARVAQRAECLLAGMQAGAMLRGAGGRARGLALPAGTGAERSPAPPPPVADATPPAAARAALVQEGELWRVTFDGRISYVRGSRGIRHLVRLLEAPGQELHALELQVEPGAPSPAPAPEDGLSARGGGEGLPVLDAQAKAAYRERLAELEAELEEAERFHDPERAERARTEREAIARELAAAMGLGGRDRQAVSAAERARSNVSRAIRSAVRRLEEADPALAEHLRRCVRTGTFCVYDPPPGEGPAWELGAAG